MYTTDKPAGLAETVACREFPGVYGTIAELMWHCIKTSVLTVDQFARFMEAYYQARIWEESEKGEPTPDFDILVKPGNIPDAPVIPMGASDLDRDAAVPPEGEDEPVDPPKNEKPSNPIAKLKRRVLGELQQRRAAGVGMQDIINCSRGAVTQELILAALEARPLPVSDWEAIGKALKAAKISAAKKNAHEERAKSTPREV